LTASIADFKTLSIIWLPLLAMPFVSFLPGALLGGLLGINLATFFILLQGNTLIFSTNTLHRVLTAFTILGLLFMGFYLSNKLSFNGNIFLELFTTMSISFVIIRGSVLLAKRLNFIRYKL